MMESCTRERLMKLVEDLTTSGAVSLDKEQLKELKKLCRDSDKNVQYVFSLLMSQLCLERAQVRLSCVNIIRELFTRSHSFRQALCGDFQRFLQLTVTPDVDAPLPPPHDVARTLRRETLRAVDEWQRRFGENYRQLEVAYRYLKHVKKVDFDSLTAETDAESRRQQAERERMQRQLVQRLEAITSEMADMKHEMERCVQEMDGGFELLIPKPNSIFSQTANSPIHTSDNIITTTHDFIDTCKHQPADGTNSKQSVTSLESVEDDSFSCCDETGDIGSQESTESIRDQVLVDDDCDVDFFQRHGMTSHNACVVVLMPTSCGEGGRVTVTESDDTSDVITSLRDNYRLVVNKFLPMVRKWLKVVGKCDDQVVLRRTIDIKESLTTVREKFESIEFCSAADKQEPVKLHAVESEEDSDVDLLEEVPSKIGVEETVVYDIELDRVLRESLQSSQSLQCLTSNQTSRIINEQQDPTSALSQHSTINQRELHRNMPSSPTVVHEGANEAGPSGIARHEDGDCLNSRKAKLLSQAPVVRYDVDIQYSWNQDKSYAPQLHRNTAGLGRGVFTSCEAEEGFISEGCLSELKTRVIDFSGKFEPVQQTCRARLASGKLCPRQDRYTCPFHGKIVLRDEDGKPIGESDEMPEHTDRRETNDITWQELELEVMAARGADVAKRRKTERGSGKRRKSGRETNTERPVVTCSRQDTSRYRLAKRIFNRRSQARVADALDDADRRRNDRKFEHQWNYREHVG